MMIQVGVKKRTKLIVVSECKQKKNFRAITGQQRQTCRKQDFVKQEEPITKQFQEKQLLCEC